MCAARTSIEKESCVSRPRIAVLIPDPHYNRVLVGDVPSRLHNLGEVVRPATSGEALAAALPDILAQVDVCLTGWGTPPLPIASLPADAPLRLIAHTAGSVRHLIPAEAYARGIQVTHAAPLACRCCRRVHPADDDGRFAPPRRDGPAHEGRPPFAEARRCLPRRTCCRASASV